MPLRSEGVEDLPPHLQAASKLNPGEHFLGNSHFDYVGSGSIDQSEIQYTKLWLLEGLVVDRMRVFVDAGGTPARHVRCGVYDQTDAGAEGLDPNAKLAETAETDTDGFNGAYLEMSLLSAWTVPKTGYYWLAVVIDSPAVDIRASSGSVPANFIPVRRESTTGTTLPATASTLTNPASPVAYVAALEQ